MSYPYKAAECRNLSPEELDEDLKQFSNPAQRSWLLHDNAIFFWTWMWNLKRQCDRLKRELPQWLESILQDSPPDPTRDRLRGMLIGLAVGDALGAAVEFKRAGTFPPVVGYRSGPHPIKPGDWTDDTSMALALADSIASAGWDINDQARRYVAWRDTGAYSVIGKCFDCGNQTSAALNKFKLSGDARSAGNPAEPSSGNGSIMRLAPVPVAFGALFPDQLELLATLADDSSVPTHPSPICRSACRYFAVLLAALASGAPRDEVFAPDWPILERLGPLHPTVATVAAGSFRSQPPEIRGTGFVIDCLEAALWAFHDAENFREAVLRAVNLGDDSDTTGAVAGQLAGALWGESGIPEEWRSGLGRPDMIEKALSGLRLGAECNHFSVSPNSEPSAPPATHPRAKPPTWTYWANAGELLAGCYPGSKNPDEHRVKLTQLLDSGVRTIISLMQEDEKSHDGHPFNPYEADFVQLAAERGITVQCLRFAIEDQQVPTVSRMQNTLDAINRAATDGPVYVHCWGGVGRTGTVIACWLLSRGLATSDNVFDLLVQLRSGDLDLKQKRRRSPENSTQDEFILNWGSRARA